MYSGRGYVARKLVQTNDGDDDVVVGIGGCGKKTEVALSLVRAGDNSREGTTVVALLAIAVT